MALFRTVEEIKQYISVNVSTEIDTILPYIKQSEIKFIKPVLGAEQYNALVKYYNDEGSFSGSDSAEYYNKYDELIEKVQLPLVNYAYSIYMPIGAVQISEQGVQIISTDTKKTAFEWQVDKVEKSFLNTAFDFTEELLKWLEENKEYFPLWVNSDAYTEEKNLIINTAKDFNEWFFISESRRLFIQLKSIMKSIEKKYIITTIYQELYDEIKNEILTDTVSADNLILLNIMKPAIAHLTMERAISELSIKIIPEGVFESSILNINEKRAASLDRVALLKDNLHRDGNAEIKELQAYLDVNASATKYVAYYNSDLYIDPVGATSERGEFKNDSTKGLFVA
jgi:hypothetical protein